MTTSFIRKKIFFFIFVFFSHFVYQGQIMEKLETVQIQNSTNDSFKIYIFLINDQIFLEEIKTYTEEIWLEKLQNAIFFQQNTSLATKPFIFSIMKHSVSRLIGIFNDRKSIIGCCIVRFLQLFYQKKIRMKIKSPIFYF
jgi:hypothetical protein